MLVTLPQARCAHAQSRSAHIGWLKALEHLEIVTVSRIMPREG
jgi:hypothetical protein